jgi:hypothetical protein
MCGISSPGATRRAPRPKATATTSLTQIMMLVEKEFERGRNYLHDTDNDTQLNEKAAVFFLKPHLMAPYSHKSNILI